jgi:hypothetical protein
MAETFSPLSSGSLDSPRDGPLADNVPLDEYINERLVGFQKVVNQRIETFEQCLVERLTSINPLPRVGSGVGTA